MADAWDMYAVRLKDGLLHYVHCDRRSTAMYGVQPVLDLDARIVEDADPSATHWGWLPTGKSEPIMIYPVWGLFSMCFPYGPKAEQDAGKGRIVRLAVTEATDAD